MLNGSQSLKSPTCVPRALQPTCRAKYLDAISSLNVKLAGLNKVMYDCQICNFTQDDPQFAERLSVIEMFMGGIFGTTMRAFLCDDLSSSVCENYATFVETTALFVAELFLQKAYNPLFPLGEEGDLSESLYASKFNLMTFQQEVYKFQLEILGSSCDIGELPQLQAPISAAAEVQSKQ